LIIDFDVHQAPPTPKHLFGRMSPRWQRRLEQFELRGPREAHYSVSGRFSTRADAWPEKGVPGSDLDLMREQLLDRYGINLAVLGTTLQIDAAAQPRDLGAAMTSAINDWTRSEWLDKDDRLLASICTPFEYGDAAVKEIERWAGDRRFVAVLFNGRTERPLGNPKYWPIFEAAERHGLPIEVHVAGIGGNLMTSVGLPTYYIENHTGHLQDMQTHVVSLVLEGVFERFPKLRVVLVEGGFSWVGPLKWRLDRSWQVLRDEVPHLSRPPSEYVSEHCWFTTQPMEEPPRAEQLTKLIEAGQLADRLLFSTDYPHWDFDAPDAVLTSGLDEALKTKIRSENARFLLGLQ
jgi:uncharacterized protein